MIYLDNAATSLQKPAAVAKRMQWALRACANPGRGGHPASVRAASILYQCRQTAAAIFDTEPERIVFTMNATHGLNLAIHSLVKPGDRVVISGFEHNAVLRPLIAGKAEIRRAVCPLFDAEACLKAYAQAIEARPAAVIVNHVSNVFGFRLPLEQIAAICAEKKIPLIVDASQSAGIVPISMKRLQAAFIAMPGHKGLYGPQGTGLLLCGNRTKPLLFGGTGSRSLETEMPSELPERLEAGTQNVPGIAGLLAGLEFVQNRQPQILRHELSCRDSLCRGLSRLPGVRVFSGKDQLGVVSFQVQDADCETFADKLAEHEIAVRAGLHCAPEAHRSAGTLQKGTVRASVSAFTSQSDIRRFLEATEEILKKQV